MTKQETPQVIGVRHVGLSARDPAALAAFYRDVLGLQVVGGSTADTSAFGATAFLSSHPAEEAHDLALFANPVYRHTAFKVRSLADLRAIHQRVIGRGVSVKMALNHGVSLAFYFDDPEGHMVEVYWPTGVATRQPHGDPIDLTLSEEALRRDVAELAARAGAPPAASGADPGRVVLTLPEEQPWAPVGFGNRVRVLAGPEQTGGRLTVLEGDEAQDYVTVQHSHEDADETLYVPEGTLSVFLDGQRRDVGPDAYMFIPRGRVHAQVTVR